MTIETKVDVGSICFIIWKNKVIRTKVEGITIEVVGNSVGIRYLVLQDRGGYYLPEIDIFPTREVLLASL